MDPKDTGEVNEELEGLLEQAREAYEADDSTTLTERCRAALKLDADNAQAWVLLAKFGGWDSRMHFMDIDFCIESATHALGLLAEGERYDVAAEVYTARKKQIAARIEDDMMMPSYTGAKQLHQTMQDWQRLLVELPCLGHDLIESELTLIGNLCLRSKMGIMPGDRLVYTAYSTLNGKEPYDATFRKALASRMAQEAARESGARDELLARLDARRTAYRDWVALENPSETQRKTRLEEELAKTKAELDALMGQSGRTMYLQQIEELEQRKAKLGPFKVFHRREADAQIASARAQLDRIDATLAPLKAPLEEVLGEIQDQIAGLGM